MILVVGACGSGKSSFVRTRLGIDCVVPAQNTPSGAACVCCAQELVRTMSPAVAAEALGTRAVVLIDEVGCGVVPIDPIERAWREDAGRLGCLLAERADTVVRMVCGIPLVLKGSLAAMDEGAGA